MMTLVYLSGLLISHALSAFASEAQHLLPGDVVMLHQVLQQETLDSPLLSTFWPPC